MGADDKEEDEAAVARFFAPSTDDTDAHDGAAGEQGMALTDFANGNVGHLETIDAEIARLEAELREKGALDRADHMEGDEDNDPNKKKKFMTIKDLKPTPLFDLFGASPQQGPLPPDAVVDTGRRLKDGASFPAIRSPVLFGIDTPIYVHDLLLPIAIILATFCLVIGYFWAEKRRACRELELQRKSNEQRQSSDEQLRRLLTALLLKTRSGGVVDAM